MRHIAKNKHMLVIDEDDYNESPLQQLILDRLTMAAADPDVRQTMNIEDEVLSVIERRDNTIAQAKLKIEEKEKQIAHKDEQIAHKDEQIALLVRTLVDSGRTSEEISALLNIPVSSIADLL